MLEAALTLAQAAQNEHLIGQCHGQLASSLFALGEYEQGIMLLERGLAVYRAVDDRYALARLWPFVAGQAA